MIREFRLPSDTSPTRGDRLRGVARLSVGIMSFAKMPGSKRRLGAYHREPGSSVFGRTADPRGSRPARNRPVTLLVNSGGPSQNGPHSGSVGNRYWAQRKPLFWFQFQFGSLALRQTQRTLTNLGRPFRTLWPAPQRPFPHVI